jgi:hypothetical protein
MDSAASLGYLAVSFPASRLIGYLYSIDDLSGADSIHTDTPYAASLYFEGRAIADESRVAADSVAGEWDEVGLISLDKCIGNATGSTPLPATLNTWTQNILGLTGADRDKAFVNVNRARIVRFNHSANQWQDIGASFTQETDPIGDVDNQTHYADFATVETWSQFRFTVKSIMNVARLPSGAQYDVAMPEMQLFGLPAEIINEGAVNTVATVSYLKAEGTAGTLHDILGKHQTLLHQRINANLTSTIFRFYIGTVANIATTGEYANRLYLAIQNADGTIASGNIAIDNLSAQTEFREISITGDRRTSLAYYEVFIYSDTIVNGNNEKIILSSGYVGGQL